MGFELSYFAVTMIFAIGLGFLFAFIIAVITNFESIHLPIIGGLILVVLCVWFSNYEQKRKSLDSVKRN